MLILVLSYICLCVSPYCRLMLQFDIPDVTREGEGVSCQLTIGQSSVPHYQQLEEFTARLAPGVVSVCMSASTCSRVSPVFTAVQSVITITVLMSLGKPDPAPALPCGVQRSCSKAPQSFSCVDSWPKPYSLACCSVPGPELVSAR